MTAYCHYDSWHESMPNDGIYREEHQRKDRDLQCSQTIVIHVEGIYHFWENFLYAIFYILGIVVSGWGDMKNKNRLE